MDKFSIFNGVLNLIINGLPSIQTNRVYGVIELQEF